MNWIITYRKWLEHWSQEVVQEWIIFSFKTGRVYKYTAKLEYNSLDEIGSLEVKYKITYLTTYDFLSSDELTYAEKHEDIRSVTNFKKEDYIEHRFLSRNEIKEFIPKLEEIFTENFVNKL